MELSGCGGNMLVNILDADATNEELLNQLYLQNNTAFANLYADLYNIYGTPPIPAFNLMGAISFIRNNVANNEQVINMLGGYFSPSEIEAAAMQLSQGLVQSALPFGSFVQLLNCMPASDLCTAIANNYPDLAHLRDLLMQNADPGYMLGLALQNDPNFIKTTSQNQSYLVAEALRMLEDMSVESYLRKVEQGYGGSVLEDLLLELQGDLTFTKKLVLKEHHLYGSSRLGVKTHKRVLLRKEFSISGFSEGGEVVEDEIIDSLVYVTNENYFCRVLGQKQYELANHTSALLSTCLGNVLATVLDRRTAAYHPQADTFLYFMADVVNASMYYPFGSEMVEYSNEKFGYVFGFNGKETDSETRLQDYGFRIYNKAFGKFLSVDPIQKEYPELTPYQFASNCTISGVDLDGLEFVNYSAIIQKKSGEILSSLLTFTDVNDATVLVTMWTRGTTNAINIDGSKASSSDKTFAIVGAFIPFVSGSTIAKGLKLLGISSDAVKGTIKYNGFGGDIIVRNDKKTTVLGRFEGGIDKLKEGGAFKQEGLNFLNSKSKLKGDEFFEKINKPFLDAAIKRGDEIRLVSDPNDLSNIYKKDKDGKLTKEKTTFGKELDYLKSNNYQIKGSTAVKIEQKK